MSDKTIQYILLGIGIYWLYTRWADAQNSAQTPALPQMIPQSAAPGMAQNTGITTQPTGPLPNGQVVKFRDYQLNAREEM